MEPLSITTSSPTVLMGTTTSNESTTVLSSSSATLDCHTRIVSFSPLADLITKSGPPSTGLNSSIPPWKERVCLKRYKLELASPISSASSIWTSLASSLQPILSSHNGNNGVCTFSPPRASDTPLYDDEDEEEHYSCHTEGINPRTIRGRRASSSASGGGGTTLTIKLPTILSASRARSKSTSSSHPPIKGILKPSSLIIPQQQQQQLPQELLILTDSILINDQGEGEKMDDKKGTLYLHSPESIIIDLPPHPSPSARLSTTPLLSPLSSTSTSSSYFPPHLSIVTTTTTTTATTMISPLHVEPLSPCCEECDKATQYGLDREAYRETWSRGAFRKFQLDRSSVPARANIIMSEGGEKNMPELEGGEEIDVLRRTKKSNEAQEVGQVPDLGCS